MGYDTSRVEQNIELKDGRTIFKTHNGFRSFVKDKKGIITPIFSKQYIKFKRQNNGLSNK